MTTVLSTPDIVCDGCANAITNTLGRMTGVSQVAVDIASKTVTVAHEAQVSREALAAALDQAGFPIAA